MQAVFRKTAVVLEMIKFQHTIFALPFAATSMLIAAQGWPKISTLLWIFAACFFARSAAMGFNRWADARYDARNPRTASRAIPAGQLTSGYVLGFVAVCVAGFMLSAAMLNQLALLLSPVALLILLGYSYTKRFTTLSHFVLGLALALAPVGAWVAVRGEIGLPAVLLGLAVMTWTAGFDLIYSCQDTRFDQEHGLFSIPSRYGTSFALNLSRVLYVITVVLFLLAGYVAGLGWPYLAGITIAAILLLAEHLIVDPESPDHINTAFFTINSWVGVAVFVGTALEFLLH